MSRWPAYLLSCVLAFSLGWAAFSLVGIGWFSTRGTVPQGLWVALGIIAPPALATGLFLPLYAKLRGCTASALTWVVSSLGALAFWVLWTCGIYFGVATPVEASALALSLALGFSAWLTHRWEATP